MIAACELSSKAPDERTRSPVMAVPGATPTDPLVIVVCTPFADTAVPACTANRAQLPRGTVIGVAEVVAVAGVVAVGLVVVAELVVVAAGKVTESPPANVTAA